LRAFLSARGAFRTLYTVHMMRYQVKKKDSVAIDTFVGARKAPDSKYRGEILPRWLHPATEACSGQMNGALNTRLKILKDSEIKSQFKLGN